MLGWIEGFSVVRSVAKQVRLETVLMASQGRMVAISFPAFECDCYFVFIHYSLHFRCRHDQQSEASKQAHVWLAGAATQMDLP